MNRFLNQVAPPLFTHPAGRELPSRLMARKDPYTGGRSLPVWNLQRERTFARRPFRAARMPGSGALPASQIKPEDCRGDAVAPGRADAG